MTSSAKCYLCDGDAPPADAGRPPVCERCDPRPSEAPEGLATLRAIMTALDEHQKSTSWVSWPGMAAPLTPVDDFIVPEAVTPPPKEPGVTLSEWMERATEQLRAVWPKPAPKD